MKIDELSNMSGVSARSIRMYIDERILRPPIGRTRSASYTEAHRRDLARIQALRASGWSLEQIREEMQAGQFAVGVVPQAQSIIQIEHRHLVAPGVRLVFEEGSAPSHPERTRLLVARVRQVFAAADLLE